VENFASDENRGVERREHERHVIPAAVTCTFFEEVLRGKGSFQGFIQDNYQVVQADQAGR
jgi:hypothetical protein